MAVFRYLWTWHLSSFHLINWVFNWRAIQSTYMSHVTPLSLLERMHFLHSYHVYVWSNQCFQFYKLCFPMFKVKLKRFTSAVKTASMSVLLSQSYGYLIHIIPELLFHISCRRCRIHHGSPSTRLFLSTSAHHPRNSLRNKFSTFRSVCLNNIFSHSRHRFTSLTFDR